MSSIDNPHEWNFDYEQFYVQLRHEYQTGFRFYFDKEEETLIEQMNSLFKVKSYEEQMIDTRYRKPQRNESYKLMSASMIALQILTGKVPTPSMIQKIGKLMHKRGYKSIHRNSGGYYKVVEIPYDQQQMYITLNKEFKTDESKSSQPSDSEQLELPF